ncbi:hypothetical protein [Agrobacterium tumefaciens]|uniref:hypothetical protein n=1 Tax=Agrobacterium tumefaciens TaxID=358 RepID=UPI0021D0F397|nr:hypothetical protein [Agrobacterium tumefaciens]UXS26946.1 hypothetical protein FY153_21025 [Agrobacterium tumefaciens]UXS54555.1 hypothetical protein FY148_17745 [Agrobacterium tumefaciens]UXS65472.1 hypothetical protein FY147_21450 [Agrobacterium tumefaciens]
MILTSHVSRFFALTICATGISGCSDGDERPMLADVAAAANVRQITELDCKTTNDGEPGYLCWFKSPQINSYAASIRVQKGWLGWKKIGGN